MTSASGYFSGLDPPVESTTRPEPEVFVCVAWDRARESIKHSVTVQGHFAPTKEVRGW